MNEQQTELDRMKEAAGRVLWPDPHRRGPLAAARRVAGVVTVVGTLVQVVVWLMIAVLSGDLDSPWWAISAAGGATVVAGLWVVDRHGLGIDPPREGGDLR